MNKYEIHKLIPENPPENFCISPFQNTKQAATDRVSTCAYSSKSWKMDGRSPDEKWDSSELNQRRLDSILNIKSEGVGCERCWLEEAAGKKSLRQRQSTEYFPNDYKDYILSGKWLTGPNNASFKVSNICNLACRTCFYLDSNYFKNEGLHYAKQYDVSSKSNIYYSDIPPKTVDFSQYFNMLSNVTKLDFYGGEPTLNSTHLDLLKHLINIGRSSEVELYYSTNCTIPFKDQTIRIWEKFKRVGFGISIDGIGPHAEYIRWPSKWQEVNSNIEHLKDIVKNRLNTDSYIMGSYTISNLNVFEVDKMIEWYQDTLERNDCYFINMVNSPDHMSIKWLPDYVKDQIRTKVKNVEVLNYINVKKYDEHWWKKFIIWTKRMDLYRKQDFIQVYPDYYNLIKKDWDAVTDLSENNFNNPSL